MRSPRRANLCATLLLVCPLLLPAGAAAAPASLWSDDDGAEENLLSEVKGHKVGDVVTVVIVENATATHKETTQTKKENKLDMTAGTGPLSFLPGIRHSSSNDFQGDGAVSRTSNFTTRVAATIVQKLPNGNLVIEGKKVNQINEEIQEIEVRGTIRARDILGDNTVLSTLIADAEIRYRGKGIAGASNKPGILHRLSNWVF